LRLQFLQLLGDPVVQVADGHAQLALPLPAVTHCLDRPVDT